VIFKLATELCTIMDQLKVSNYDLSCLNLTACPPEDFQALIQLLINKICELNGLTPDDVKSGGCPDCVVSVAECFVEGTQTTMQLLDYVQMIADRVCSILAEIQVINDSITNLVNITNDLQFQIDNLPVYELPKITLTSCSIGSYPVGSQVSLDALINVFINNVWCPFYTATGTTSELLAAVAQKCVTDATLQLSTGTPFGSNSNWIADANYNTVADAINNIWVVLCDVFNYVENSSLTVQDTNTVDLTYTSGVLTANIADTGWEPLNGFDHYSGVGKPQCRRIGNQIHFRGGVIVPIATPGSPSIVEICTPTSYNAVAGCQVFAGTGGCYINSNGSIVFNNDNSVIPTTILDTLTNFDNTYSLGLIVGTRPINLDATYGTALTAVFNVGITNDKKLYIAVLKDLEITNTRGSAGNLGSSHLRYITSNVTSGEHVPNFINAASTVHSSPNNGLTNTVALPAPLAPDTQYLNNLNTNYNTFTYPFSCDAGNENQIGGFVVRLDGLIAYVDPCTTDIKPYICE
jgi:hypothetical protein